MSYLCDLAFERQSDGSLDCEVVQGDVPLAVDREAVKQRVENRCFVRLSRWIADPWFGSRMGELTFAPKTPLANSRARSDISRSLRMEPWIVKNRIKVSVGDNVKVEVTYLDGQPLAFDFTLAEV